MSELTEQELDAENMDMILDQMVETQSYVQEFHGEDIGSFLGPDTLADLTTLIERKKAEEKPFTRSDINLCIQGYYFQ